MKLQRLVRRLLRISNAFGIVNQIEQALSRLSRAELSKLGISSISDISAGQYGTIKRGIQSNTVVKVSCSGSDLAGARLAAKLNLKHVVKVLDVKVVKLNIGRTNRSVCLITMERLNYMPALLEEAYKAAQDAGLFEGTPLTKPSVHQQQFVDCIAELQRAGVNHTDMSLENFMVSDDGVLKLIDLAAFSKSTATTA